MMATGWSWPELMATPVDVIQRTKIYLSVKGAIENKTDLTFPEDTDGS